MKEQFFALLSNRPFISAIVSWAIAQALKVLYTLFTSKEIRLERLVGPGGMPSSHSATVMGLTVAIARQYGIGSPFFAISITLAIIVMYDAVSVRWHAGQHAKALNQIFEKIFDKNTDDETRMKAFKEVLGHTPLQVAAGIALGFVVGYFIPIPIKAV